MYFSPYFCLDISSIDSTVYKYITVSTCLNYLMVIQPKALEKEMRNVIVDLSGTWSSQEKQSVCSFLILLYPNLQLVSPSPPSVLGIYNAQNYLKQFLTAFFKIFYQQFTIYSLRMTLHWSLQWLEKHFTTRTGSWKSRAGK